MSTPEHVDVLIVGAGLSGIGAACQLKTGLPGKTVAVLEAREASGGTWDLFRYPGIRSDSDMFTFGYKWRPWPSDTALADGELILDYLRTVAESTASTSSSATATGSPRRRGTPRAPGGPSPSTTTAPRSP